jgi:two-component system, NtrC family, sensor histidine kinase PilS
MLLAAPIDQAPPALELRSFVTEVLDDWQRTQAVQAVQRQLPAEGAYPVLFEPDHLRRVLLNLLDNGWRHAQPAPQPWLRVELVELDAERMLLRVLNPSAPLPAEVERHLFEPFYSTRSRGAGLGLSICRELCERYGARIDYQALQHEGEPAVAFLVQLRRAPP